MFPKISPVQTKAWQQLQDHYSTSMRRTHMKDLFKNDPERFNKFSFHFGDILFDYSKNIITQETISMLLQLADECNLREAIEAMFSGEKINQTENRSVLH